MAENRDSLTVTRRDFMGGVVAAAAVAGARGADGSPASIQATGAPMIELPKLPWGESDLSPHISQETISYHYGKHHKAYVDNTNRMIAGTELATASLEDIVKATAGKADKKGLFNNAAQVWNHTFYWKSLSPEGRRRAHRQAARYGQVATSATSRSSRRSSRRPRSRSSAPAGRGSCSRAAS